MSAVHLDVLPRRKPVRNLPATLSYGIGAEIQRPLARVVIGGPVSATAMTVLVLPAVYELFARAHEGRRRPEMTP